MEDAKKRPGRPLVTTAADETPPPPTSANTNPEEANEAGRPHTGFIIRDERSGRQFLVDTGAFRSILPSTTTDKHSASSDTQQLVAANGTAIQTYGTRDVTVKFSGRNFTWNFIIADVNRPLLGADFLAHYGLLVDISRQRLINTETFSSPLPLTTTTSPSDAEANTCRPNHGTYETLIHEFSAVFKPELRHPNPGAAAKHGVYHHIKTTGPPVYSKFRRLSPDKLRAAKQAFAEMERMGVCTKASSPWASPLHMTKKSDGTWRPCGDYRRLNLVTEPDHYPMPNITDLTSNIGDARIFSKLDLLKGYFQVPVYPDDVQKTAIVTPFGSFVFKYSTFGLRNSGATFQRTMDQIFSHLPFCAVYVDDILIFSHDHQQHENHVREVLRLLQENGLVVRPDKCQFGVSKIDFLGYEIDAAGIRPQSDRVKAIQEFPRPSTVKGVQEFLGMTNYYHRFVPKAANLLAPLYDATASNAKTLHWDSAKEQSFIAAKTALADAATLARPVPNARLYLTTDASMIAVGAVLEQEVSNSREPLAFFSKKLKPAEKRYSTFDRELLAVHLAIRHFRHLLEGTSYTICTDHKPLVTALTKSGDAWSDRQQRQLSAIAETGCTMTYLPGSQNPVADSLSRVEISSVQLGIDYANLATEQDLDPETNDYKTAITNLVWQYVKIGDTKVLCDISRGRPRPLVPKTLRRQVFDIIHGLAHPSIRSTLKLVTEKFVWHSVNKDVKTWARSCQQCQRSKIQRHTKPAVQDLPQPTRRFGHIHVDVVGPLPPSAGKRYLFTVIDRSTRWPEATPMEESTSQSCASALLSSWIARFGIPEHITSDRGSTFTAQLWKALADLLGTRLHFTTAYHPQANGIIERWHRSLKAALTARCTTPDWTSQLPWVMLGLRTTPKEDLTYSTAEMVYGQPLVVPGEFFPRDDADNDTKIEDLRQIAKKFAPSRPTHRSCRPTYVPPQLETTEFVFIREDAHQPPLSCPYKGPFRVVSRSSKAYKIQLDNREDWVAIERLKPAYTDSSDHDDGTYTRSGRLSRPPQIFIPQP